MQKPKKWTEVYPQGTKEGDEEQKFFISLSRNEKYEWRSIAMIAKESGLTKKRVEELLAKYYKLGLVFQSKTNEENWGYWERVPEMLKDNSKSISDKDQEKRINSSLANSNDPLMDSNQKTVSKSFYDTVLDLRMKNDSLRIVNTNHDIIDVKIDFSQNFNYNFFVKANNLEMKVNKNNDDFTNVKCDYMYFTT